MEELDARTLRREGELVLEVEGIAYGLDGLAYGLDDREMEDRNPSLVVQQNLQARHVGVDVDRDEEEEVLLVPRQDGSICKEEIS